METALLDLSIRTYGTHHAAHSHDFDQLVLPLDGELLIEIGGREDRLIPGRTAVIARGSKHIQMASATNCSLVLNISPDRFDGTEAGRLLDRPFHALSPAAMKLVDFMAITLRQPDLPQDTQHLWTELLLDALTRPTREPATRLSGLRQLLEHDPGRPWSIAEMAERASVSVSHLHALFRQELNSTPKQWLADLRLRQAQDLLRNTNLPIGEIAYRCGYADQSAFTRSFLRANETTPSAWRKQAREFQHKS